MLSANSMLKFVYVQSKIITHDVVSVVRSNRHFCLIKFWPVRCALRFELYNCLVISYSIVGDYRITFRLPIVYCKAQFTTHLILDLYLWMVGSAFVTFVIHFLDSFCSRTAN